MAGGLLTCTSIISNFLAHTTYRKVSIPSFLAELYNIAKQLFRDSHSFT